MSNRFGRNKRRAAREQIANLAKAEGMSRELLRYQGQKLSALEYEIEDAKRIAGNMSVLFPSSKVIQIHGEKRNYIQVAERMAVLSDMKVSHSMRDQRLSVMLAKVNRDALTRSVQVRVQFGDGEWGYGTNEETIRSMPIDIAVRRISEILGELIAKEIHRGVR